MVVRLMGMLNHADSISAPKISTIGVITCNRQPQLMRCLNTYESHTRKYERAYSFLVTDDTQDADQRAICRERLLSFARRTQSTVFYAGHEEKLDFMARLILAGIPSHIIHFGLFNEFHVAGSPGANRNALLLHTAGEAVLSCDDDSVCWIGDLRRDTQSVCFGQFNYSPLDIVFTGDRRSATKSVQRATCDLLAAHEQLLGHTLVDLQVSPPLETYVHSGKIGVRSISDLAEGRGRVVVTLNGVVGDSGIPFTREFMMAQGATRERFLECWRNHEDVLATRYVVRGVHRPTILANGPFMTPTATGFDNRKLLVPFIPAGLGEDTLFGRTLHTAIGDAYVGYLPLALLHAPPRSKPYLPLEPDATVMNVMLMILEGQPCLIGDSVEERIKRIGRHFFECGSTDLDDFTIWLQRRSRLRFLGFIDFAERLLDVNHRQPAQWAQALDTYLSALRATLTNPDAAAPTDFGIALPPVERFALTQRLVRRFGELLQWWPDIVAEGRRLKANGVTLGKIIS